MNSYEKELIEKFKLVLEAAYKNPSHSSSVQIETTGTEPKASVTIPAYILKKFLEEVRR